MSFLYRYALTVTRKDPWFEWARSLSESDAEAYATQGADAIRTVYLVPETDDEPSLAEVLDQYWEHVFEHELAAEVLSDTQWPEARTREMFDAWFDVELTSNVYDLTPEEPLTQADVDAVDLAEATITCAWCGRELEDHEGRYAAFMLADRKRFALFEGRVLPLTVDDERMVLAVVRPRDEAPEGEDVVVRVCGDACARAARSVVPEALRRMGKSLSSLDRDQ